MKLLIGNSSSSVSVAKKGHKMSIILVLLVLVCGYREASKDIVNARSKYVSTASITKLIY